MYDKLMGEESYNNGVSLNSSQINKILSDNKVSAHEKEYYMSAVKYKHLSMIMDKGEALDKSKKKVSDQLLQLSNLYMELYTLEQSISLNNRWLLEKKGDVQYLSQLKNQNDNLKSKRIDLQLKINQYKQKMNVSHINDLMLDDIFSKSVVKPDMVNLPEFRMKGSKVCFLKDISQADAIRMSDNYMRSMKREGIVDYVQEEKNRMAQIDRKLNAAPTQTSIHQSSLNNEQNEKQIIEDTMKWAAEKWTEEQKINKKVEDSPRYLSALAVFFKEHEELRQDFPKEGTNLEELNQELRLLDKYSSMLNKFLGTLHVDAVADYTTESINFGDNKTEHHKGIDAHYSDPSLAQEIQNKMWQVQMRMKAVRQHINTLESSKQENRQENRQQDRIFGMKKVNKVFSNIFGKKKAINVEVEEQMTASNGRGR